MDDRRLSSIELLAVIAGGATLAAGGVVWAGAHLAGVLSGERLHATLGDALTAAPRLARHPSDPAAAWPEPARDAVAGPLLFWPCTGTVAAIAALLSAAAARLLRRSVGTNRRQPLGVDARAKMARPRDLRTLIVREATPGRLILGRIGGHLIATESRSHQPRTRWRPRSSRRAGDRGAVAMIGPSRSGKTTAIVSGVLEWDGPAVLSSVKDDLLRVTAGWRAQVGEIAVFDPTSTTGMTGATWSPLRNAGTTLGAQRAARSLCDAAPRSKNVEGGLDYWLAQAEMLLSGLLFVAHHTGRDMGTVCEWVLTQDSPSDRGPGEVEATLRVLLQDDDEQVRCGAQDASRALLAIWADEERSRAGVYSTARTVVWPWANPGLAASSRGSSIGLDWLLSGSNTVYLCAPIEDRDLFGPAFGGLLNDLIKQVYVRVAATGQPIDPPLLIIIDEAGNTPLRSLPEYASTLAGMGVVLVTAWQSLAQINALYNRNAGTILTNHLSKLFYAGVSDPETKKYIADLVGNDEVESLSRTTDDAGGRSSMQRSTGWLPLIPGHVPRQMLPGDALLIHGTLPPAHIKARPYYRDPSLAARASLIPPTPPTPAEPSVTRDEAPDGEA